MDSEALEAEVVEFQSVMADVDNPYMRLVLKTIDGYVILKMKRRTWEDITASVDKQLPPGKN